MHNIINNTKSGQKTYLPLFSEKHLFHRNTQTDSHYFLSRAVVVTEFDCYMWLTLELCFNSMASISSLIIIEYFLLLKDMGNICWNFMRDFLTVCLKDYMHLSWRWKWDKWLGKRESRLCSSSDQQVILGMGNGHINSDLKGFGFLFFGFWFFFIQALFFFIRYLCKSSIFSQTVFHDDTTAWVWMWVRNITGIHYLVCKNLCVTTHQNDSQVVKGTNS